MVCLNVFVEDTPIEFLKVGVFKDISAKLLNEFLYAFHKEFPEKFHRRVIYGGTLDAVYRAIYGLVTFQEMTYMNYVWRA